MLNFFKRSASKLAKTGDDDVINSKDLLGEESESTGEEEVTTSLHFHPTMTISQEERYYYQFLNNELLPLKENQISLSGIEVKMLQNAVVVVAFLRNSLAKAISFGQPVTLSLLGPAGEVLARQEFDLSVLGEIPAKSSIPWQFIFNKENVATAEIPQTDWKLAFELRKPKLPHALDLEESWEKSLAETDIKKLDELVKNLTPPKAGEVNFMGLQARIDEEGALHAMLLIRNGSDKNILLEQIPLTVEDASGEVIAKGSFVLEKFEVKANTSKPWTFIFPKSLLLKEEIDLARWKAYVAKK